MAISMGQIYRQQIQNGAQGRGAQNFAASAQRQALGSAQAIGAGMRGVAPGLAMRSAQQAAARSSGAIAAQAAQMRMQEQQQAAQMAQQQEQADQARMDRFVGMGLGVAGSAAGMLMSDEEAKVTLGGGAQEADRFIAALEPERYQYREATGQPGDTRLGVMAQDVERGGAMGAGMVGQVPGTEFDGLDKDKAMSALLASVGRLGERLDSIEGRRGRR